MSPPPGGGDIELLRALEKFAIELVLKLDRFEKVLKELENWSEPPEDTYT